MRCKDNSIKYVRINSAATGRRQVLPWSLLYPRHYGRKTNRESSRPPVRGNFKFWLNALTSRKRRGILRAACEHLDWDLGALWMIDGDNLLRCVDFCKVPGSESMSLRNSRALWPSIKRSGYREESGRPASPPASIISRASQIFRERQWRNAKACMPVSVFDPDG